MKIPWGWNHRVPSPGSLLGHRRSLQVWQVVPITVFSVLLSGVAARGDVKLPALISDNMVLQQGRQVAIWGTADAGEQVTVSFEDQKQSATADASGQWKVELAPLKQGGPFGMTVAG